MGILIEFLQNHLQPNVSQSKNKPEGSQVPFLPHNSIVNTHWKLLIFYRSGSTGERMTGGRVCWP